MTPFEKEKRRIFTVLERAQFFSRAKGHCEECTRKIPVGEVWHLDHRIPLAMGGTNDDDNCQILCAWCHDAKTYGERGDLSDAAKSKRVYAQHVVPRRFARSRAWRWGRG